MLFFEAFISAFKKTIDNVYPVDGVDYCKKTQNNDITLFKSEVGRKYRKDRLTRLSSFFGLSNRQLDEYSEKQTLKNIWHNFIGYKNNASNNELLVRKIISIPLNLIFTPLRFLINSVKILTEVIPGTISLFVIKQGTSLIEYSQSQSTKNETRQQDENSQISSANNNSSPLKKNAAFIFGYLIWGLGWLLRTAYLAGRSLTSPIENVRNAYYFGVNISNKGNKHRSSIANFIGIIIATGAACLSIITFSLAIPLGIKALVVTVGRHMPTAIVNVLTKISNSQKLTQIGNDVLTHPIIAKISNVLNISAKIADVPAFAAIGYILGGTITTLGSIANYVFNKFKENIWHRKLINDEGINRAPLIIPAQEDTSDIQKQNGQFRLPDDDDSPRKQQKREKAKQQLRDGQRRGSLSQDGSPRSSLFPPVGTDNPIAAAASDVITGELTNNDTSRYISLPGSRRNAK